MQLLSTENLQTMEQNSTLKAPPCFIDFEDTLRDDLLQLENLPSFQWERSLSFWQPQFDVNLLSKATECPPTTAVVADRNPETGAILSWREIPTEERRNPEDMSMSRPLLPPHLAVRGSSNSLPFLPAGFQLQLEKEIFKEVDDHPIQSIEGDLMSSFDELKELKNLQDAEIDKDFFIPFGNESTHGGQETNEPKETSVIEDVQIDLDIGKHLAQDDIHLRDLWTDNDETPASKKPSQPRKVSGRSESERTKNEDDIVLENSLIPEAYEIPILNITTSATRRAIVTSTEWAEEIDVTLPVKDFAEKVPNMAHCYPFELDTFQKQAIIKLEEGNHVFVAAHTSAGKTVVAEYAIALSQNHCTRTIYTSPIKALSNQKYNDFKKTFKDVGLMTGDLQINPTAACLVMTTEILRSMLYGGSDVTRDLEFVIFDEVHYINNAERGHVWEEVLILLPVHVGIVLLSATVPNTIQFADWVGRTKKRKVYVVSTPKRPVPLCHYLYTGSGGKSKNERFLVLDQDGNFLLRGYNEAVAAKAARLNQFKKTFGPKGGKTFLNPKQEQTMWVAFIDHLKANDKLPVVAFTLSRNRCDQNAEALMSIDLTTAKEKSHIHNFFQRCLQKLKEPDRKLPQVLRLQRVLSNGVGIHHSGILPLLKEIVEMLFHSGHVKILFATETFAMGVNMPARTVVFDEITKFDGVERRNLAPAEYIQMAGRAGRRGLDATGTVIILCKEAVPDQLHLKEMMLGTPQRLSSQFRLTYAMILSLIRVAQVSVEGMMQRSFREFHQQLQVDSYRRQLEQAEKEVAEKCSAPLAAHLSSLAAFYETAADYIEVTSDIMPILLDQPKVAKEITPGRVFVVSVGPYMNQLAVFLNKKGPRLTPYKVLLLETSKPHRETSDVKFDVDENWYRMLSLSAGCDRVGTEEPTVEHTVLCIAPSNILKVTKQSFAVEPEVVIQDWEKRQMPRFKDAPVGAKCSQLVQELSTLSHAVHSGATELAELNLKQSLSIKTGEILDSLDKISFLQNELELQRKSTNIANFKCEFSIVYERKQSEHKRDKFRRLLSYENMALYPDYLRRLNVLSDLRYIDENHRVLMKGKVACEMGTNELIITELIFQSILTDLSPADIAALLSCLVFQARTQVEHTLSPSLQKGVDAIKQVDNDLLAIESKYLVGQFEGGGDRLNFGLVKVVYEWADNKPFADIMELTDVQEGIIVRCIQQLHEVLIDVRDAAKIIGDPKLYAKMQEASSAIKRDIVFAASLYTTDKEISG